MTFTRKPLKPQPGHSDVNTSTMSPMAYFKYGEACFAIRCDKFTHSPVFDFHGFLRYGIDQVFR